MLFGKHANISIRIMQGVKDDGDEEERRSKKKTIIIQPYECRLVAARHGFEMQTHSVIR